MHCDYHSLSRGWRRTFYFARQFAAYLLPKRYFELRREKFLHSLSLYELSMAQTRADYYCRLAEGTRLTEDTVTVGEYKFPFGKNHKFSTYFFDLYTAVRYFPSFLKFRYLFGDVSWEEKEPTLVKSRPITAGKTRNVVMKLNQMRHFYFMHDKLNFNDKSDMIVFRNVVRGQEWRETFVARWIGHEMTDIGKTNADGGHEAWLRPYLTINEQLHYKFIATIEGNDVATNLKWVMSSNSIAVMPRPRMESWFMEGRLIPNYHYIEVRPDYSDLIERLQYYIDHPIEAQQIIDNAHRWVAQFCNPRIEKAAQLLTLKDYFERTSQLPRQ